MYTTPGYSIDPDAAAEVHRRLNDIAAENDVRILLAVESGSRAWGFGSPDSDYDVRFLYVRPREWYLALERGRDALENPIELPWDVNGWDITKALSLMLKSNAVVLEWLTSPIVYVRDPLSAPDIEARVLDVVAEALEMAARSCADVGIASASEIERAHSKASITITALRTGSGREQRGLVSHVVQRVELHQDEIIVSLALETIDPLLAERGLNHTIPIRCVRSSKQLKLIIPPAPTPDGVNKNLSLIKLVTQAAAAREALAGCDSDDFDEVATAIGYGREHAADLLRIGYLAPDIISAILDGRQPHELTRSKLIRWAGLPLCWQQQRVALGFS